MQLYTKGGKYLTNVMNINIGSVEDFIAEMGHSYDALNRTDAAKDSLSREISRTKELFGESTYGKWEKKADNWARMYPDKVTSVDVQGWIETGELKPKDIEFKEYVEGETDPKAMTPEFRTHSIIEKRLWDELDKGI